MKLQFYKYQGTGNDFVMIDNRSLVFDANNRDLVAKLCHRRFGIGADGLILLQNLEGYDFEMVYFNADGNPSSMCGNGGRALVAFAHDLGVITDRARFLAIDGPHDAHIADGLVHLKMKDVDEVENGEGFFYLNTGSPHYVRYEQSLTGYDVFGEGKAIRYNDRFRAVGTNVNFVERLTNGAIWVRTYERGVEDETYSCGTGVTAAAITAHLSGMQSPIKVKTLGGDLAVSFTQTGNQQFEDIYLIGPAIRVFEGTIEI